MPRITQETVRRELSDGPCGKAELLNYGDTGGLTQFGAVEEILQPGAQSSIRHWHANEDELVYMLAGTVTLIEGDSETPLRAGDVATFKAGVAAGHCLVNRSGAQARYLVVGTRAVSDVVTYPDHARRRVIEGGTARWEDLDGNPADKPF